VQQQSVELQLGRLGAESPAAEVVAEEVNEEEHQDGEEDGQAEHHHHLTSSPPRPSLRHAVSDGSMGIGKVSEMEEIERERDLTSGSHMPEPRQRIVSRPCWQFEVDYRDLDLT
jgi:hypothetical protein